MPNILNQRSLMTDSGGKKKNEPIVDYTQPVTPVASTQSTPYPSYYSPTAGATYNYNQSQPTWNWDQQAPTWSWDQQAPTWSWDESGKPGEWQWDDSGRPGEFSYADAPTYTSQYQDQINQMVQNILNRPAFSYDYNQDPLYQQYAEAYTRNGTQAMNDTLAQMAARTGGLASSYAGTASQQTYNKYMDALNDKIPELYQLAYGMYRDEGNNMRNNLSMMQGLENTDYGRFMDQLGQYNTDRNLAYNQWQNALNQYNTDRNFAYGQYQDLWDRYYNDRNFSYGQYQDALDQYNNDRNFSYGQYQDALGQYNNDRNFSYGQYQDQWDQWYKNRNFDYDLWADNLSRQEAAAKAAYNSQVAAWEANQPKAQPTSENPSDPVSPSGSGGTISVVHSGQNLHLEGPDGKTYIFSTGSPSELAPILNAINNMNISQSEKERLLNQVESEVNKFLSGKKSKGTSSSGSGNAGGGSSSGGNNGGNRNNPLYSLPPSAQNSMDRFVEEELKRRGYGSR